MCVDTAAHAYCSIEGVAAGRGAERNGAATRPEVTVKVKARELFGSPAQEIFVSLSVSPRAVGEGAPESARNREREKEREP